jgi:transcriptional regulator with XRE-family HTH domain
MVNQHSASEKKAPDSNIQTLSIRENEKKVDVRLREVIGEESLASFGRRCGISEGGIRKYLNGASPSTEKLVAIADTTNVSIEWLATGRGHKQRGTSSIPTVPTTPPVLDESLLGRAISAVEEGLRAVGRALPPDKHAKMILAAYNLLGKLEVSDKMADQAISKARAQVIDFIKLAS